MNLYANSWNLYLHHSSKFTDDLGYYLQFCKGYRTLELFAGYGRVTNFLVDHDVDIEALELSPDFAALIQLPKAKLHVGNVVTKVLPQRFERIFAAYNSFCLLLDPKDIAQFFQNLAVMLLPQGLASLSYYHPDVWVDEKSYYFAFKGADIQYVPEYDLSRRQEKFGVWIDRYRYEGHEDVHRYPVRIYESREDMEVFLKPAGLKIKEIVHNYNNSETGEQGWVEYVLQKA